jgi:hypothetical protein
METPRARSRSSRVTPPGGVRLLVSNDGAEWVAREVLHDAEHGREGPASRVLQYTVSGLIRTVRNYPPDWFDWAEADLLALVTRELPKAE